MNRVLVTGATTPLGVALVHRLAADARVERVLACGIETGAPALAASDKVTYVRADLCRARELRDLLFGPVQELGITVLVHAAFHRAAAPTPSARRLHVEATRQLLHLAERHATLRRFVLCGSAEIYRIDGNLPSLLGEEHPIDYSPTLPGRVHDRMEADQLVCGRMGMSPLEVVVLRLGEIFAPDVGSQLYDYVSSVVCLRPLGYDPMLNLLAIDDAARAIALAVEARGNGIFNIPGLDTLPLSRIIARAGRIELALPGPLLQPLYALRAAVHAGSFAYRSNVQRLHFTGLLDGTRAERELGYRPTSHVQWRRR